jgi:RNA polymerase sigma factor (sigma-70 family)
MPRNDLATFLRCLRSSGEGSAGGDLADAELLERFRAGGGEAAFVVLMQRHGPMVLGVCRRLLANAADAEDAFQATFLVLAARAASVRARGSLGSWLHGVARRAALSARKGELRRRARERRSHDMTRRDPPDGPTWNELRLVLDDEVSRLPEKYRAPVVLCYLEGKTNEQAARELGCPKSSVGWRLGRARALLRGRLARRGVSLPAAALAAALTGQEAASALPALLVISTARAATRVLAQGGAAARVVSGRVTALTEGLSRAMVPNKGKVLAALLLAGFGGVVAVGARQDPPGQQTAGVRPERPWNAGVGPAVDGKAAPRRVNDGLHLEMMRWVATDVDPAKGTISARATWRGEADETREGLTLSAVPVAADAAVLVNGTPGKLADLRPGMILSLRLAEGAPRVTTVVAVKPKAALTSDVLEAVDVARRRVRVRLAETNTVVVLPVAGAADVAIDGKPARLEDLRGHSRVSVRLAPAADRFVVESIRAHVMPTQ